MKEKYYRFFGGLLGSQERWLNKMSREGHRLVGVGRATYEFEPCRPGQYRYKVEYIGQKSKQSADEYVRFLEDCGYRVFFKNINLGWSAGKVVYRPWAEPGGRLSTESTTLYRELLLVEKEDDGKPFELHTTYEDLLHSYRAMRRPWLWLLLIWAVLGIALRNPVFGIFALLALVGLVPIQVEIQMLKRASKTEEW